MPTLSFKISESEKDFTNDVIETFAEKNRMNKSDAFVQIIKAYKESLIEGKTSEAWVPPDVSAVLESVDCPFLQFMDSDFYCLEKISTKKKPDQLIGTPQQVKMMCEACSTYREQKKQAEAQKLQQKEYIKRLTAFMKSLITITEKGFISDVQFCLREVLDGNLVFSRDGKTITCPLMDNELVYIEEKCQTMLNPKTGESPCQYFATIAKLITLDKDLWEQEGLELPQLEELDLDKPEYADEPEDQPRRKVEPEYTVQDDEETENEDKKGEPV